MKIFKIYIDTSVFGGVFDQEFSEYSLLLFNKFRKNEYLPVISDITIAELENAPDRVKNLLLDFDDLELIEADNEMKKLAAFYLDSEIVSPKYSDDALHIAIATICKVDVLVSWNFKHIVNLKKIHQFNSVNLREGYNLLEIRTPREVISDER
ncbi:MAG: PIN domain protein [Spirochaetes bacterium]|nr:PIN domain protein [Spirochaetota bacterium]MBN2770995.1 PIN domain protein [Spirochaetota bacterium]HRX15816.1 PIN domain protein [Spirochaetota bacterium]